MSIGKRISATNSTVQSSSIENGNKNIKQLQPIPKSMSTKQYIGKPNNSKHIIIRRIWVFHFLIGLLVVLSGIYNNGGKKYVPIDVNALSKNHDSCIKAYANVHADSIEEEGAIICCRNEEYDYNSSTRLEKGLYESLLCTSKLSKLPFASTLTRIRDSWLFPLIPLLLRLLITGFSYLLSQDNTLNKTDKEGSVNNIQWWSSWRRLFIYFLIMNVRGWGLYIFLNMIQDSILNTSSASTSLFSFTSTFMIQISNWKISSGTNDTCWYQNLLLSKYKHKSCYGRSFDFSDHMVLFFGQTLPVMLFEILFCVVYPFWKHHNHYYHEEEYSTTKKDSDSSKTKQNYHVLYKVKHILLPWTIILFLLCLFLYFNFITLIAAHKTATYFHTPAEIIIGYCISLVIQLPLGLLVCFYSSSSEESHVCFWTMMRQFIGFHI